MGVPFVDLTRRYAALKPEIDAAVARTLASGWYLLGDEARGFEEELGAYLTSPPPLSRPVASSLGKGLPASGRFLLPFPRDVRTSGRGGGGRGHVVGVASGTDALVLALEAAGIGPGDDVLCPALTATATPMAIRMVGATPIFVDVEPGTLCLCPEDTARKITPRTRAMVPVHLYGRPANLDKLSEICSQQELIFIEDCAQSAGSVYHGQRVGTFGALAAFSFYPTKNLGAFGDAGAVVTQDAALAESVRQRRAYGEKTRYHAQIEGRNSRLDELQAAILRVGLPYLDATNARRREIAEQYSAALNPSIVEVPADEPGHTYHLYVVRSDHRSALQNHLKERGVATMVHYPVAQHRQPAFANLHQAESCPVASREVGRILSLPLFPELTDDEVGQVIAAVNSFPED